MTALCSTQGGMFLTAFKQDRFSGWICSHFTLNGVETSCGGEITDPGTRFPLASVTKTFTAHLCLQPDARRLLDVPFREQLPGFNLQDPEASRKMTPRDALCHFSGLEPHTPDWVRCPLSRREYFEQRLPLLPAAGPFREKHRYSNLMYAVLGLWLEELAGRDWESLIQTEILDPLEMNRTGQLDESWTADAAPPHALNDQGIPTPIPPFYAREHHLIAPASELIGSMPDLARWGQFQLTLPADDERWRPHSHVCDQRPFPVLSPLDYGLGWRLDQVNGEPRFWHSGQCSGYSTLLTLYPRLKRGMAAAVNCSGSVDFLQAMDLDGFLEADAK